MIFAYTLTVIIENNMTKYRFGVITVISLWAIGCMYFWFNNCNFLSYHKLHAFILYWIGFAGLCGLFAVVAGTYYNQYPLKSPAGKTMMWIFNTAAIISLSIATVGAIHQITIHNNINISNKASITILWSVCAFVQMWLGMRLKYKTLRIISLSLLALVICKLFIYDLSSVSQGAKIIAFVVLGVVLLVMSFLYQKLKKILFEEE
jgi:uncharacterized membrane protein